MNNQNKPQEAPQVKSVEDRYSVALVFTRQTQEGSIETMLRNLVCYAKSETDALGEAIIYFQDESKGFGLICKCVIKITPDHCIAELEKQNAEYREALEKVRGLRFISSVHPSEHGVTAIKIAEETLKTKDNG